jgi:hypothetical protein
MQKETIELALEALYMSDVIFYPKTKIAIAKLERELKNIEEEGDILTIAYMSGYGKGKDDERARCCSIVYGMAGSDNVAQRTVDAIRKND